MSDARFFAVDRQAWQSVCRLGINEAVSYLIIASGTGRDHRTSAWSATSVEKYSGMHHVRAKEAISQLLGAGFLTVEARGKLRRYKLLLGDEPQLIWLPTSIIEGINGERPPVKLLRKAQNVDALRLFVDLYFFHDLAGNGGCEWRPYIGIRMPFVREAVAECGAHNLWRFSPKLRPDGKPTIEVFRDAAFVVPEFFTAFEVIQRAGLVDFVEHLVDSDSRTGEVIHPLPMKNRGEPGEQCITRAAVAAGIRMAPSWTSHQQDTIIVPVEAIASNVQLIGIARLLYKPHVKQTRAWFEQSAEWMQVAAGFDNLASGIEDGRDSGIKKLSRIDQGLF
ncbi:hypothetical protein ACLE20_15020 [Rhizobium sp. YIM 134829]|uniref:hypothetical protein n=1 Tax=Rhizobium sp. YIM 134829 TaxID=3390453 RepID=UPI00397D195C